MLELLYPFSLTASNAEITLQRKCIESDASCYAIVTGIRGAYQILSKAH